MQTLDKDELIDRAHWAMKCACEDYIDAVNDSIPEGSIVRVQHGKHWIGPFEVMGVIDCWWSSPGQVRLKNLNTGKFRKAHPMSIAFSDERGL